MQNENYITIQGWMINKLKLKGNELILYAIIYGFSQDGQTEYYGSLSYIQNSLQLSRPTVISLIKSLIQKNLIERTSESHYLVKKLYHQPVASKETLPVASKETLPNNNNTNNNRTRTKNMITYSCNLRLRDDEDFVKKEKKENIQNKSVSLVSALAPKKKVPPKKKVNEINRLLELFRPVNPTINRLFANKTERNALERLVREFGEKEVEVIISALETFVGVKFAPVITKPTHLENKFGELKAFVKRNQQNKTEQRHIIIE